MSDSRTPEQEAPTPATCPVCGSAGDTLLKPGPNGGWTRITDERFCHECSDTYPATPIPETPHAG